MGDIVNRGPDSLPLLRFLKTISDSVVVVLGNHDLHLLMIGENFARLNHDDTLQDILTAPDREELLHWLRYQKLLHVDRNYLMVHAGILPTWSVAQAVELAQEVETVLHEKSKQRFREFCSHMYGNQPSHWDSNLEGYDRLRFIINVMTRMRICTLEGRINFSYKGGIKDIPIGYLPWFEIPNLASRQVTVICGHWSALGLRVTNNLIALDTGCTWGGSLTAIRLEDRKIFHVPCAGLKETVHQQ